MCRPPRSPSPYDTDPKGAIDKVDRANVAAGNYHLRWTFVATHQLELVFDVHAYILAVEFGACLSL
jgi:hypothetical protein